MMIALTFLGLLCTTLATANPIDEAGSLDNRGIFNSLANVTAAPTVITSAACPIYSCPGCPPSSSNTFTTTTRGACPSCTCVPISSQTLYPPTTTRCPVYSCPGCGPSSSIKFTTTAPGTCSICTCVPITPPTAAVTSVVTTVPPSCPTYSCAGCGPSSHITTTATRSGQCPFCTCAPNVPPTPTITTVITTTPPPSCPTYSCPGCGPSSHVTLTTTKTGQCAFCTCVPNVPSTTVPTITSCPTHSCPGCGPSSHITTTTTKSGQCPFCTCAPNFLRTAAAAATITPTPKPTSTYCPIPPCMVCPSPYSNSMATKTGGCPFCTCVLPSGSFTGTLPVTTPPPTTTQPPINCTTYSCAGCGPSSHVTLTTTRQGQCPFCTCVPYPTTK